MYPLFVFMGMPLLNKIIGVDLSYNLDPEISNQKDLLERKTDLECLKCFRNIEIILDKEPCNQSISDIQTFKNYVADLSDNG